MQPPAVQVAPGLQHVPAALQQTLPAGQYLTLFPLREQITAPGGTCCASTLLISANTPIKMATIRIMRFPPTALCRYSLNKAIWTTSKPML